MGQFGDKFRKAREGKELSFDDVSNVTKISSRMLQAIEQEHFDLLPGGVFNKGFIRAYAKHLGLNPEDAVTDYLACLRQAQIDAQQTWESASPKAAATRPETPARSAAATPRPPAPKPQAPFQVEELPHLQLPRADHVRSRRREYIGRPSSGFPWRSVAVFALIIVVALFLWNRRSRAAHAGASKSAAPTAISAVPVLASAQASSSPAQATVPVATIAAPARPSDANTAPVSATRPSAAPATNTDTAAPATPADQVDERVVEQNDVTTRSFGQPAVKPSATPAGSLNLVIRATETSWISVTSDGQLVRQETLIAPANTTVRASREIVAHIGNAAGVTFLWNGEDVPAQGAEGEVKTIVFDHDGMRALSNTPPQ